MKRITISVCLSCIVTINLFAQSDRVTVMSHVANVFTKRPVADAKVELLTKDSTVIGIVEKTFRVNQREGGFVFEIDSLGQYILHCTHPEYEDAYSNFEVKRFYKHQKYMLLPTISMQKKQPKQQSLSNDDFAYEQTTAEVVVKATKVKFFLKNDTIVYNADAFNIPEGSMLEDLIRQLPGVDMDENGQISVNGRKVDELLLNGKDFFNKDRRLILDNLPYFMMDKVKVYDKFTDLQRMLGDTITNKRYAMNIGLKRKYQDGYIANVEAGYGTENRYLGRLFALRYTPNSRLSVFANTNNLSDNRKPGNNGNWSPLMQARSLSTRQSAGIEYNIEDAAGRYIASGDFIFNYQKNEQENTTTTENFLAGGNTHSKGFRMGKSYSTNLATSHRFEWKKNWGYRTSFAPTFNYHKYNNAYNNATALLSEDMFYAYGKSWMDSIASPALGAMLRKYGINRVLNNTKGEGYNWNAGLKMDQVVSFKHLDNNFLYLWANVVFDDARNKAFDHYTLQTLNKGTTDYRNRYNYNENHGHEIIIKIEDYIRLQEKTGRNNIRLVSSYTFTQNSRTTNRSLYLLHAIPGWGYESGRELGALPSVEELEGVLDRDNSTDYQLTNYIQEPQLRLEYASRVNDSTEIGFNIQLPVRIEHNRMHYTQTATDTTFNRNTVMLTPRITFQKASINRPTHYKFYVEYSLNMSVPAMLHLVRRTDNSDPLHIVQSGKQLKNEQKHDLLVNYHRNLQGQRMYNLNAGVTVKQNTLTMESIYDRTTGVRTVSPGTINGNWDAGIGGSFSLPLDKAKKITLENNNSMGYDNSVDRIGTEKTNGTVRSMVKTAYYNGTLKLNYRPTDKFTINAVGNMHLRNSYSDIEDFTTIKARDFDYGLAFSAQLPYKFQISTDITMYSRRGYNDSNMNTDDFVWNARLTRTFMKGSLVCMLDGFDILGQLSNIRRTLNAQARVETWYNVTPRYIMLHVAYRFNKQPKKN